MELIQHKVTTQSSVCQNKTLKHQLKKSVKESCNAPNYVVLVDIFNFFQVLPFIFGKHTEETANRYSVPLDKSPPRTNRIYLFWLLRNVELQRKGSQALKIINNFHNVLFVTTDSQTNLAIPELEDT